MERCTPDRTKQEYGCRSRANPRHSIATRSLPFQRAVLRPQARPSELIDVDPDTMQLNRPLAEATFAVDFPGGAPQIENEVEEGPPADAP